MPSWYFLGGFKKTKKITHKKKLPNRHTAFRKIIITANRRNGVMEVKERIKMLMEERHLNQKELARLSGVTEASMSKYLSGERTPRIDVIVNIANALNVTTDELIGNEIENGNFDITRMKAVLARGMKNMSEDDRRELMLFLLQK